MITNYYFHFLTLAKNIIQILCDALYVNKNFHISFKTKIRHKVSLQGLFQKVIDKHRPQWYDCRPQASHPEVRESS